jgi:hypothetical protein
MKGWPRFMVFCARDGPPVSRCWVALLPLAAQVVQFLRGPGIAALRGLEVTMRERE